MAKFPKTTRNQYLKIHLQKIPNEERNVRCKVSDKWKFLIDSPFKVSDKCCDILKKNPIKKYERESGLHAFTGEMAVDSLSRKRLYLKRGCNFFGSKYQKSTPLGFWLEKDVWDYIRNRDIDYNKGYDNGMVRSGCMPCTAYCSWKERLAKENFKMYHKIQHMRMQNLIEDYS